MFSGLGEGRFRTTSRSGTPSKKRNSFGSLEYSAFCFKIMLTISHTQWVPEKCCNDLKFCCSFIAQNSHFDLGMNVKLTSLFFFSTIRNLTFNHIVYTLVRAQLTSVHGSVIISCSVELLLFSALYFTHSLRTEARLGLYRHHVDNAVQLLKSYSFFKLSLYHYEGEIVWRLIILKIASLWPFFETVKTSI